MDWQDSLYLHGLNLLPNFGPKKLLKILERFETAKNAFYATAGEFERAGIENDLANKFTELRKDINLEQQYALLSAQKINLLTIKDTGYPSLLLEIPAPPPLLYFRGLPLIKDELCIAVVGTRNITNYGRVITPLLVEPLINSGITIVSGLAFGVDALAQELSFNTGHRTIAILGGGLDDKSLYPRHHALAAQKLLDSGGTLVSEYPPGTPSLKYHFLARNRIISGLAVATLVIECDLKSGSLITAKYALEQNRVLFAAPGPIYSAQSQGPNNLIKMGARPATSAKDVLEELNLKNVQAEVVNLDLFDASEQEKALLTCLNFEPIHFDEIVKKSHLPSSQISSALTFLELKGKIRNLGGQQYVLNR